MSLDAADLELVRAEVRASLAALGLTPAVSLHLARSARLGQSSIIETEHAVALSGKFSNSAFFRWAARWGLKPCGRGRYLRSAVLRALEREKSGRRAA